MKIAVPVTKNNQIDDHFGHCEFYAVFTISDNNEIVDVQTLKSEQGCGCKSNIASTLSQNGVTIMLAGGIGSGAINVLNNSGIEVVRGCSGNANELVKQFIAGLVVDSGESCKTHEQHHGEGHEHEHVCNH
ncbi:MAG TPA: dinitrogenase iron-molybdenum cofactor biosynthesis protein [Bacteroidales bacterium]|nr:dinitrogenase iron-molybdenum cofactor biosynthesis protein [Bacteroidales bacterium]